MNLQSYNKQLKLELDIAMEDNLQIRKDMHSMKMTPDYEKASFSKVPAKEYMMGEA